MCVRDEMEEQIVVVCCLNMWCGWGSGDCGDVEQAGFDSAH